MHCEFLMDMAHTHGAQSIVYSNPAQSFVFDDTKLKELNKELVEWLHKY